ncbi:50S ribosomal protein L24 [Candidatus Uhrbacteria bacterium CG_4_9_14_3_um_filter_50_9]|uniref:Large ribosomal subunit protein uL24 n=1 Tax=Candidatus Uhrbacteria bacterium CG_4_9_14_3_um_filter_50_9 TaxID=1975035 RepID=A0A2M7XBK1_9BACT|nr:MAG: 50S ribosomal protein L24 [Candidatus Uhrbacteria bacterium CG_4_9_14_3_um_filter_50_9]
MKIKTGDNVRILAGKDKGKEGKVLQVFPEMNRVVVEGINMLTKHLKSRGDRPGQKIQFAAPLHVSNLQLISTKSGKTGRVGYKVVEKDGAKKKIRVIHSKGATEDIE